MTQEWLEYITAELLAEYFRRDTHDKKSIDYKDRTKQIKFLIDEIAYECRKIVRENRDNWKRVNRIERDINSMYGIAALYASIEKSSN